MDMIALLISVVSLFVAFAGTYLANKRSKEALAFSKQAVVDGQWSALQEAVQRLMGFDPTAEPVGERLANLRIAMTALVDELPTWTELGPWLDVERGLGAALAREVMERHDPTASVDQRLSNLEVYQTWAQALSANLRRLKSKGYDAASLAKLALHNRELIVQIHRKNGWEVPPEANPRIHPLG